MPKFTFGELVGGILAIMAASGVLYASIGQTNQAAMTALVGLVGAASGYFLRAKVDPPK